jgi:hypothetical protein
MKLTISLAIFISLFICIACAQVSTKTENSAYLNDIANVPTSTKKTEDCLTMDFHYLLTENQLYSSEVRHIEVFLDETAFSEENLKKLFKYLSYKNPEPKHLIIEVKTNWKQLDYPSDCPGIGASNLPERQDKYDYFQAVFHRTGSNGITEYFRYNPTVKIRDSDFKTVIIKGKSKE